LCGWVFDFQEFVFAVRNRHLEGILPGDKLALEIGDILEPGLPELVELKDHTLLLNFLFLFAQGAPRFVVLHLG